MKRGLVCFIILFLLAGCDGKPYAHELEGTMLVQVLGVDWMEGVVELTASCDPTAGGEGVETSVLSARGSDFEEAKARLQAAGEEYVSLTHVTQIVLGEGTDLAAVLEEALNEPALSQGATVWLAEKGPAKDLLERAGGGARRLSSIELNSGVEPVTVLQSMMRIEERGGAELPVLDVEEHVLMLAGTRWVSEGNGEA